MTQNERILDYIQKNGSITPMEAWTHLGITKLATRVSEMTKMGISFNKQMVSGKNRYGQPVSYMRYSLVQTNE